MAVHNEEFTSIVAPYIQALITEKRAAGFLYKTEENVLKRFDKYCVEHCLSDLNITKEFLNDWMEKRDTEGNFNQVKRISVVKQLLENIAKCGIRVYIPHDYCHVKKALPHIFKPEEITSFFMVVDSYMPSNYRASDIRLANEYRLLFRWYLCCGMRNTEAAGIASENVDLEKGVLTLLNSKGQKDRLVYLPKDLLESSREYYTYLKQELGYGPTWFFPSSLPEKPLKNFEVDRVFSIFWSRTQYANCTNKPTVHDFRFTFVVNRMNKWVEDGLDWKVMLPYLSSYLGHKSINNTLYYYFLVNDAYKTIQQKDTYAPNVIPEVRSHE